jgi:hypothetical protein
MCAAAVGVAETQKIVTRGVGGIHNGLDGRVGWVRGFIPIFFAFIRYRVVALFVRS